MIHAQGSIALAGYDWANHIPGCRLRRPRQDEVGWHNTKGMRSRNNLANSFVDLGSLSCEKETRVEWRRALDEDG